MPSGIGTVVFTVLGFFTTIGLHNYDVLPLWACILCGVGVFGVGLYLEYKIGYMDA